MAKFAPVAPIHILRELYRHDAFGNYHLFLAHHTVEKKAEFKDLLKKMAHDNLQRYRVSPLTVIMDNSIVETGGAVDDALIREAVEVVKEHDSTNLQVRVIPVLPDVMGDGQATRIEAKKGYHRWVQEEMPGDGYMLVAQGENLQDFMHTIDSFFIHNRETYTRIKWVGIPRWLVEKGGCSRKDAVEYVRMVAPYVSIHLLGFSTDIHDDMLSARMLGVTGIDSAVPVRYDGVLVPSTPNAEIGKRGNWFERGELTLKNLENISRVRAWVDSQSSSPSIHFPGSHITQISAVDTSGVVDSRGARFHR